jgi:hypothetical protein
MHILRTSNTALRKQWLINSTSACRAFGGASGAELAGGLVGRLGIPKTVLSWRKLTAKGYKYTLTPNPTSPLYKSLYPLLFFKHVGCSERKRRAGAWQNPEQARPSQVDERALARQTEGHGDKKQRFSKHLF